MVVKLTFFTVNVDLALFASIVRCAEFKQIWTLKWSIKDKLLRRQKNMT